MAKNTPIGTGSWVVEADTSEFNAGILRALGIAGESIDREIGQRLDHAADGFGEKLERQTRGINLGGVFGSGGSLGERFGSSFSSGFMTRVSKLRESVSGIMSGAADTIGKVAFGGAALAGGAAVAVGGLTKVAEATDNLHQNLSLSDTVFGQYSNQLKQLGATAKGLSQNEFLDIANNLGSQLLGTGWGKGAATQMTEELMQRIPDIAAAANASSSDVAEALKSAMVGEYDPLQRLPALGGITANSVQTQGANMFKVAPSDLTMQQQQLALIEQIIQKTNMFQGQYNKEFSTSYLAQIQQLKADFTNMLSGQFGSNILSGAIKVVQYLSTNGIPLMEKFVNSININPEGINKIMDSLLGMGISIVNVMPYMIEIGENLLNLGVNIAPYVAAGISFIAQNVSVLSNYLPWLLAGFLAFKAVPPIFTLISAGIGLLTNPVFLVGAGLAIIAAVIAKMTGLLGGFLRFIMSVLSKIKGAAAGFAKSSGINLSAFDDIKKFNANTGNFKLDAAKAKATQNEQMKAMEKMRLNVDLDNYKASFKKDAKRKNNQALETLSQYNI